MHKMNPAGSEFDTRGRGRPQLLTLPLGDSVLNMFSSGRGHGVIDGV